MIEVLMIMAVSLVFIGAVSVCFSKDPFNKLISLGILTGGAVMFFVNKGYLDAAIASALILPIGTLFILMLLGRKLEGSK